MLPHENNPSLEVSFDVWGGKTRKSRGGYKTRCDYRDGARKLKHSALRAKKAVRGLQTDILMTVAEERLAL